MPVGNYFKGGLAPTNFIVSEAFDRAAPYGTGAAKVGETMQEVCYQVRPLNQQAFLM